MSQVAEQSVRFQTALASIKLIQASAVLDLTEDDFYSLSLHDALPISAGAPGAQLVDDLIHERVQLHGPGPERLDELVNRSEEHTSALQSQFHIVCRLLLAKKIQTSLASIKLIQASAVLDLTEDDIDFL